MGRSSFPPPSPTSGDVLSGELFFGEGQRTRAMRPSRTAMLSAGADTWKR